jgi:hypothetical protein
LTRKEFRRGAHVHGALLVRFFCHRIHAAAGLAQLACDPGEVNQFQDVLIPVGPADDAFSAEDDGSGRFGEDRRGVFQRLDRHAGVRSHLLQRYVGHGGLQGFESLRVLLGAVFVDQVQLQGGLHDSVDYESFRSGLDQDGMGCELGHVRDGGIDDHHLRFIDANRFFDAHGREWVCLRDVGANEYHGFGFCQVFPVVRAPPNP